MLMPQMGESITEAKIIKWLKRPGEKVKKDEPILEISTDKVDSEIPAPAGGVVRELFYKEGDLVPVKTKIAVIETEASAGADQEATTAAKQAAELKPQESEPLPAAATKRFYSPLVTSLAAEHGVSPAELDTIPGSGQEGRVTKQDLLDYIEARKSRATRPAARHAPKPPAQQFQASILERISIKWDAQGEKIIPMDNMRRLIAERMLRSKNTSPHAYSVDEVDLSNVSKWRVKQQDEFERKEGIKLTLTPFFLEAVVRALLRFPFLNSTVEGQTITLKKDINLGCAVSLGDAGSGFGLIVPVIKNAEEKTLTGLAQALHDLATRARSKKLLPDEAGGGTFTVTNPGIFGTILGVPIINQPQTAILCVGKAVKRPIVVDDMLAIREMCYLTLSYDHRVIDGALAGMFLTEIKSYLESWDLKRTLY